MLEHEVNPQHGHFNREPGDQRWGFRGALFSDELHILIVVSEFTQGLPVRQVSGDEEERISPNRWGGLLALEVITYRDNHVPPNIKHYP